ncbi:bitesize isoform X2 [Lycorma delicatula]|uniref:bitesize isoform X2 n=1 Tax=Lycorma delicatula TaxID=130591 RepID=UPI003F51984E
MEAVETPEINILEHTHILNVFQRDEFLRSKQEIHVMRLKEELQELRRKGLGAGGRTCARCRAELGRIINRGAFCRACRFRVCKSCREYCNRQPTEWLCTVCHKHMELAAATGDWMNEFVHHPDKRGNKINAETIKHSIQRSWTFSDASPSPWLALRGSPEMRAYSSMPRHQDCEFITRTFKSIVQPSVKLASESSSKEDENKNSKTQNVVEKQDNSNDSENERVLSDIELKVPNEIVKASSDLESGMLTSSGGEQSSVSSSPMVDKRSSILESSLASPVLRKVTLKKRRIDSRNLPPGVTPPRSRRHLRQNQGCLEDEMNSFLEAGRILVPDGEDYKLVFISSSDSSSREELQSDDASSTSSGLVAGSHLEDCDWDYFEAAAGPIKPIVKDWSWVGGGDNVSGGGEGQARAVVAHRASQQSASARTVSASSSSASAVLPIPVPIPVPVPFLVPVPWHPELTIRVQHSLAPLWRDLLHHGGLAMTEENPRSEKMPASEVSPVDELLCNKAVSDVILRQEAADDKDGGVVLTMYKSLDEAVDSAGWGTRESVPNTIEREDDDDNSLSSTCSEDESDPPKRKAMKRVYRFDSQRDSASEEEDDSLREFGLGAAPPKSLSSSSGESSDECDGKHFSKMYIVNEKDRAISDIPGLGDNNVSDVGSGIALLKHVQVDDIDVVNVNVINKQTEISSHLIDKHPVDSSEIKLSHILNPKCEEKPDTDVKGCDGSSNINLKTVLSDVTCRNTCSDSAVNGIKCQNSLISCAPTDLRTPDRVDLEPVSGSECVTSLDADSLSVSNAELVPTSILTTDSVEDPVYNQAVSNSDIFIEKELESSLLLSDINQVPDSKENVQKTPLLSETSKVRDKDLSVPNDVIIVNTVQNILSNGNDLEPPSNVDTADHPVDESHKLSEAVDRLELSSKTKIDMLEITDVNKCSYLKSDLTKNKDVISRVGSNLLINDCIKDVTVNLEPSDTDKKNLDRSVIKTDVESTLNQDSDVDSDSKTGNKINEEGTRSSTSDEFSGTESMELNVNVKEESSRAKEEGQLTAVSGESWRETGRYTSLVMITQDPPEQATATVLHSPQPASCDEVHIVTGADTLSCLEEGLADDDSWVEDLDREELNTTTEESSEGEDATFPDREEELRGYHRTAIDFTLHTIVEESCEESEVEQEKNRPTELEKYFFYGLGDGNTEQRETDTMSETSSIYSEGLESMSGDKEQGQGEDESNVDPADLASSRLEKYFLSGFMGFSRRDSDGSVGSDSEGRPSPEQRRKRLVRARGTGRLHSSSLDNLLAESEQQVEMQIESEGSTTETDSHDETSNSFEKTDGQFDTVKRTKKKKRSVVSAPSLELLETPEEAGREEGDSPREEGSQTPQPELLPPPAAADLATSRNKQQSRDSGFMGSCDDLLKEGSGANSETPQEEPPAVKQEIEKKETLSVPVSSAPPTAGLSRKDSFNNWSSDEETNLMMSKMRAFFKTMVGTQPKASNPNARTRSKPPQLVYFESELTRLMKTVPGIRDEQVKEIVEYLSSEDTWSDSYDSSDYTSSDLEGASKKSALQEQISASCRQIISKFESGNSQEPQEPGLNRDTALVYHRLVASFSKMETPSSDSSSHSSPPLIAKVMQHIGSRLVALMHEVSGGEGGPASPKTATRLYHRRLQPKLSATSTTEEEEDSMEDYSPLPRSKSHDPLLEASDNERFSWRGSFESALMAGSDSRTRLESSGAASKRRSASDLLLKSCSRDQLDRVRSCGSIGGSVEDKIWGLRHPKRRRSSVPDSGGSADGEEDSEEEQRVQPATNSLPRLPTTAAPSPSIYKAHSVHQFNNVKSARYRPPGRSPAPLAPPPRRNATENARRNRSHQSASSSPACPPAALASSDDGSVCSEPIGLGRNVEEDVDRLINQHRASLGARSDSLASVYSGAGEGRYGSVTVRGEVEFGLQYNYKQGALEIHIKQCRDLAPVDIKRNRSDPYVKVYLLPDKSKSGKRKTRVKKHTLNPVFEETLKFHITLEGLESRTLWLSVWHSDMFGRNDFLGEVTMSLENKIFDDPLPRFYTLQERSEPLDELLSSKGELIVGLKFIPPESLSGKKRSKGALHVLVKEAKNLTAVKSNGLSDPFCKSYLLPDKMRSSKQKTPVLRRTCHPAWNHTFTYQDVGLAELAERSLELTIWDHDRLASNEFLGGVRINLGTGKHYGKTVDWMDSSGKEVLLWQWMMEKPNLWVESCLQLRPSLDVRNNS